MSMGHLYVGMHWPPDLSYRTAPCAVQRAEREWGGLFAQDLKERMKTCLQQAQLVRVEDGSPDTGYWHYEAPTGEHYRFVVKHPRESPPILVTFYTPTMHMRRTPCKSR